jgi:hypothetical protein
MRRIPKWLITRGGPREVLRLGPRPGLAQDDGGGGARAGLGGPSRFAQGAEAAAQDDGKRGRARPAGPDASRASRHCVPVGLPAWALRPRDPSRAPGHRMAADGEAALGGTALPLVGLRRAVAAGRSGKLPCGEHHAPVTVLGAKADGVGYRAGHARGGDSDGRTALRCYREPSLCHPERGSSAICPLCHPERSELAAAAILSRRRRTLWASGVERPRAVLRASLP